MTTWNRIKPGIYVGYGEYTTFRVERDGSKWRLSAGDLSGETLKFGAECCDLLCEAKKEAHLIDAQRVSELPPLTLNWRTTNKMTYRHAEGRTCSYRIQGRELYTYFLYQSGEGGVFSHIGTYGSQWAAKRASEDEEVRIVEAEKVFAEETSLVYRCRNCSKRYMGSQVFKRSQILVATRAESESVTADPHTCSDGLRGYGDLLGFIARSEWKEEPDGY